MRTIKTCWYIHHQCSVNSKSFDTPTSLAVDSTTVTPSGIPPILLHNLHSGEGLCYEIRLTFMKTTLMHFTQAMAKKSIEC